MSEVKKLLFIINKYSGTGYQPNLEGMILTTCERNDIECTITFTKGTGHATQLAKEGIEKGFTIIVAVGGDGTVNEVAQGLVHSSTAMAILPKGSGNGIARHLGIPLNLQHALNDLLNGTKVAMDTFTVNGRLSINVSGIGFDGHIANLFSSGVRRGLLGYIKLILKEYFSFKEFDLEVAVDNQIIHQQNFILAIANSSQYGNNARIAPLASVGDKKLELASIKKIPLYMGLSFGIKMFSGRLKESKQYTVQSITNAIIKSKIPIAFHVDGEPCGHSNEFIVNLQPQSLNIIVPNNRLDKI
jgi:YegS/Rv2252/BmrU family lipid kinase